MASDPYTIFCYIIGLEGVAFSVKLPSSATIDELKDAIKDKKKETLKKLGIIIAADELTLWRASPPFLVDELDDGTTKLSWISEDNKKLVYYPAGNPLRSQFLRDDKKTLRTRADNLLKARKKFRQQSLEPPSASIGKFFVEEDFSVKEVVHVLVELPGQVISQSNSDSSMKSDHTTETNLERELKRARLDYEDAEYPHERKIASSLFDLFWKKRDSWAKACSQSSIEIPELAAEGDVPSEDTDEVENADDNEPLENGTARVMTEIAYVDLTNVIRNEEWPISKFASKFLVRNEYLTLDKYLNENLEQYIILLGQPGIGKTVYLTYKLIQRLIDGKPTYFVITPVVRYLFHDGGVLWLGSGGNLGRRPDHHSETKEGLVLVDLNETQQNAQEFGTWRCLFASSPMEARYKEFTKQHSKRYKRYVLQPWSWEEIYSARIDSLEKRSVEEWRAAFTKYGGSARTLLARHSAEAHEMMENALNKCENIKDLFPVGSFANNNASNVLVEVYPNEDKNGIHRNELRGRIVSRWVFNRLQKAKGDAFDKHIRAIFHTLFNVSGTRPGAGILFERAGHDLLSIMRRRPFSIRSLSKPTQTDSLDLSHVTEIVHFNKQDIKPFRGLDCTKYYKPASLTNTGIDSFALECRGNEAVAVVMFQFTISTDHPVKTGFFPMLWHKYTRASTMTKWKLIFVVPQDIADEFKYQSMAPNCKVWTERVDQYVLSVDINDVYKADGNGWGKRSTLV